jgi:hypothetical protein
MAAMHTIEIADRDHGAGERPAVDALRAAARDMEVFCGRVGPAHRNSGRLQKMMVKNVHIFSSREHLGRSYGYRAVNKLSN